MDNEIPGAVTPWPEINRLLNSEERYEIRQASQGTYLLAPTDSAKLSALLFLCQEKSIPFNLSPNENALRKNALISLRALTQIHSLNKNDLTIAVETGCSLHDLSLSLFSERCELGASDWIFESRKLSIGQALLQNTSSGEKLQGTSPLQRLYGIEMVQRDGTFLKLQGPSFLHRLNEGLVTLFKFHLLTAPEKRIYLTWSFSDPQEARDMARQLNQEISSWERLDLIITGNPKEKNFILAQIAGTKEEMAVFKTICPFIEFSSSENLVPQFQRYFKQNHYRFENAVREELPKQGAYSWTHLLTGQRWICFTKN